MTTYRIIRDRRAPQHVIAVLRRGGLSERQLQMLSEGERHGWRLAFVRDALEHPMLVLCAGEHDFVVVHEDGSLDRDPQIELRH